jgi:hypothetical protein
LPGSPAGFSCTRSRNRAFMPDPSGDAGLAELIAHAVRGGQRLAPSLRTTTVQQIQLTFLLRQRTGMHTEQPHRTTVPRTPEQRPHLFQQFDVDLRSVIDRVRPRVRGEIRIPQLQLHGAREQPVLAQTPSHHLRKPRQHRFQHFPSAVSSPNVCSWLIDFGSSLSPISPSNHPPASRPCDLPARASPHFPNFCSRNRSSNRARSPTLRMPNSCSRCSPCFTDARNLADVERRKESPPPHPARSIARRSAWPDRRRPSPPDAMSRCRSSSSGRFSLHRLVQFVSGLERRAVQPLRTGEVQIRFVNGRHRHLRRVLLKHAEHLG